MTSPLPQPRPQAEACPHCGHMPDGPVTVCKRCGKDYYAPVHPGDQLVGIAACIVGAIYLALTAGGFA